MIDKPQRPYKSAVRARQATETRNSIAREAERLFMEQGYERTTVGAIAAAAEVAPQTVYAVFGSKLGILKGLIEANVQADAVLEPCRLAMETADPRAALGHIVELVCRIFHANRHLHEMLRGSTGTSPELRQLMIEQQQNRRVLQEPFIRRLYDGGYIRADYDFETALDTFWCLLNHEMYRLLVDNQGWSHERFRPWFTDLLVRMLLRDQKGELENALEACGETFG